MNRLRVVKWTARIVVTVAILLVLVLFGAIRWLMVDLPSPDRLYEHAAAPGGAHQPSPRGGQAAADFSPVV